MSSESQNAGKAGLEGVLGTPKPDLGESDLARAAQPVGRNRSAVRVEVTYARCSCPFSMLPSGTVTAPVTVPALLQLQPRRQLTQGGRSHAKGSLGQGASPQALRYPRELARTLPGCDVPTRTLAEVDRAHEHGWSGAFQSCPLAIHSEARW